MKAIYKAIYNEIKKFDTIYIARHIGPDPDAFGSQIGLRDSIKISFPDKKVYAVGSMVARFKCFGKMDKVERFDYENSLVITTDIPDKNRVDGLDVSKFKNVIKIDHHPFVEKFGKIECIESNICSASEIVLALINQTKLKINQDIAGNLFMGIVSDSNRFLFSPTNPKTFRTVADLIEKNRLDIQDLYIKLYSKPLSETRLMGYIASNMHVSKNGLAYIWLEEDIIKSFGADLASASNMINEFNNINEVLVWLFVSRDEKNDLYRVNIRSKGPVINGVASAHNGGGHRFASGVRTKSKDEVNKLLDELEDVCRLYKKEQ